MNLCSSWIDKVDARAIAWADLSIEHRHLLQPFGLNIDARASFCICIY